MKASVRLGLLGLFVVLAAAYGVTRFAPVAEAQVPGVTKTCSIAGTVVTGFPGGAATTFNCTITITANVPAPFRVTITGPAGAAFTNVAISGGIVGELFTVNGAGGTPAVNTPVAGAFYDIGCPGGGSATTCEATPIAPITITETITVPAASAGAFAQTITPAGGVAQPLPPAAAILFTPAGGPFVATKTCVQSSTVFGQATCTVTIPGPPAAPPAPGAGALAAGNTIITLTGPAGATFIAPVTVTVGAGGTGTVTATLTNPTTITVNCVPAGAAGLCIGPITITETLAGVQPGQTVTENIAGPGAVAVPLPAAVVAPAAVPPAAPGALTAITITCPGAAQTLPFQIPGQIGGAALAGIGTLPAALQCQAVPTPNPSVPGTFTVSSVNGVLVDASGNLNTVLRIACGSQVVGVGLNAGAFNAPTVPSCAGVSFAVLGLGVGLVELRVRFDPAPGAPGAPFETATNVGFVAPSLTISLLLSPNPVVVGQNGTATARFNRSFNCSAAVGLGVGTAAGGVICIDPTTGLPIAFNFGSALNGNTVFTIDNTAIATFIADPTATPAASPQVTGFVNLANQAVRRCGFFPTTGFPFTTTPVPNLQTLGPLAQFFGGCESTSVTYRGVAPGIANITASFIPDLPGAFGTPLTGIAPNTASLLGLFGNTFNPVQTRTLEVLAAPISGVVQLARGCNNVSPTVTETAAAYAARVSPQGALVAIWEHQAATNTFRGFSPQAGAPNDLPGVTRLRPVFVCVSAAATLDQPPA